MGVSDSACVRHAILLVAAVSQVFMALIVYCLARLLWVENSNILAKALIPL